MLYGISCTVEFFAIDTATGKGKTGDGANFTLRWVKDGTSAALSGSPSVSEVDATNEPGLYKVTVALADTQCMEGALHGKSATTGIEIVPRYFSVLTLPNAAPAATGGLPTLGTGAGQISVDGSGNVAGNVKQVNSSSGAATKLERGVRGTFTGTVGTGSTTTNIVFSSLSPASAVNDQVKGKVLTFDDLTTTAALRGQSQGITAYVHSSLSATVAAFTTAAVSGDTFTIS